MILVSVFWLLFLAPGAAIHTRRRAGEERASGFETIAIGYMLSFLVLAPLCVVGYVLELPLWAFSTGIVLAIVGGLAALVQRVRSTGISFAWQPEYLLAAVTLAFFLLHATAVGGHISNDADFHLARIRLLYDHGLTNADPITGTGFSHPYHTNIVHALIAAGAKLTGLDPIVFWQGTLPWAKLVSASSTATLCLRLGGGSLAAWTVCLFQLGAVLRLAWAVYPNQLAPTWLVPVALASCIGMFATERVRYHAVLVGGSTVLLGLVHGLYAGYFALIGGLVFCVLGIHGAVTKRRSLGATVRIGLLGALLLALPAPSLYVARYAHPPAQSNFDYQGGPPTRRVSKPGRWTRVLRADEHGRFHLPTKKMLGGTTEQCLAAAALLALLARKRRIEALALAASLGSCLIVLNVPAVASFAIDKLGAVWMLERLLDIVTVQFVALVGAGLVLTLRTTRRAALMALGLVPVLAAVPGALEASGGFNDRSFNKVKHSIGNLDRLQLMTARLPKALAMDQELVHKIPAGSVVLTHPLAARQLRKLHDISFVRASRNHTGVDDMLDRTKDMSVLIGAKGPTINVQKLLAKYRIVYAIQKKDHPVQWLGAQKHIDDSPSLKLIKLQ
jgi:hypothetical protein